MAGPASALVCHASTVMGGLLAGWRESRHTDAELRGEEGAGVRCHRLVLAAASPFFGSLVEEQEAVVVLPGVGQELLHLLLTFLYTGEIEGAEQQRATLVDLLTRCHVRPWSLTRVTPHPQVPLPAEVTREETDQEEEQIEGDEEARQGSEEIHSLQDNNSNVESVVEFKFKCDTCDGVFSSTEQLEIHLQSEHGGFVCDLCDQMLGSYDDLLHHKSTHRSSKNFKCSKCSQVFRWRAEYRRHAETSHGQKITDMTTCHVCSKKVVSKRLNEHIKMVHGNSKPYTCKQCDKKFSKPSELKNHERIHSGERPFECDICHASFSYSHILSRHKKYHEGSKKFSCNDCGKSFLQKNDLMKHMRIHSGEKPYKCELCNKTFARMDYLKKHSMLHLSDTKFCCTECGELCGSVDGLKKHKKHSHSGLKPENQSIELNSFDDLALLPHLSSIGGDNVLESISELQAVSLDGGKTIMILEECDQQVYTEVCLEQEGEVVGGAVAVVGKGEVLHLQSEQQNLGTFAEQTEVLYAVEY